MNPSILLPLVALLGACADVEPVELIGHVEAPPLLPPASPPLQVAQLPLTPHAVAWDTGGIDDTAVERTWFYDDDGDGPGAAPVLSPAPPPRRVAVGGDCDDTDPLVHPDQRDFFLDPRPSGSYDYDCDGTEEQRDLLLGACDVDCSLEVEGWDAVTLPDCGEGEAWLDACEVGDACEIVSDRTRIQACR